MKILYAASEAAPFIKTGGLADVAGSLPIALRKNDCDIRVVMPLYSTISPEYRKDMEKIGEFYVSLNWRNQYAGIFFLERQGVKYYFIDNEYYFKRDNIYGEFDDGERFSFFSKAVTLLPRVLSFKPDIIHVNDWHTGLVPLYVRDFAKGDPFYEEIKTVFTIHNLKYQGVFPNIVLDEVAGLSREYYCEEGLKFYDNINFMKSGIVYSDRFNTVSNTYAKEIQYPFFGEGLEGIIKKHEHKLTGIVNGIDYNVYSPDIDENISKNYDISTIEDKGENKIALQRKYNLPINGDIPVIAMVSRLVSMKGLDIVRYIMDELLQEDIQFIVLGTGDREYEDMFRYFQGKYPDRMAARIYFNEGEAHMIYAGADIFVMPSMIEPCGISQLISLKYGTIPIVREIGGLKDTIIPYNRYTGEGNGFSFANFNAHELLFTIRDALKLYKDRKKWEKLMIQAMKSKNDWEESSKKYMELYGDVLAD